MQAPPLPVDNLGLLRDLDLTQKLAKEKYETQLEKWQGRLNLLSRDQKYFRKHSLILVFEGSDAAGKGGAIRRITGALDARHYQIVPIAAPTEEERAQPYLWRFWRHVPRRGRITIFDRSWYGRVLVERVEGFCARRRLDARLQRDQRFRGAAGRAAARSCASSGCRSAKDEQLRRFKEREKTSFKRFKITEEDWRNRKKWDDYEQRRVRHDRPHQHRDRAVDAGRGRGQVPCAHQGAQDHRRADAVGALRRNGTLLLV